MFIIITILLHRNFSIRTFQPTLKYKHLFRRFVSETTVTPPPATTPAPGKVSQIVCLAVGCKTH